MTYLLLLQKIREASAGVLTPFMLEITSLGESLVTYLLLAESVDEETLEGRAPLGT